jgi:hypothetical protein
MTCRGRTTKMQATGKGAKQAKFNNIHGNVAQNEMLNCEYIILRDATDSLHWPPFNRSTRAFSRRAGTIT